MSAFNRGLRRRRGFTLIELLVVIAIIANRAWRGVRLARARPLYNVLRKQACKQGSPWRPFECNGADAPRLRLADNPRRGGARL
jgi:prepilin-type N-terminal cleavage/methylation domain-containing protein